MASKGMLRYSPEAFFGRFVDLKTGRVVSRFLGLRPAQLNNKWPEIAKRVFDHRRRLQHGQEHIPGVAASGMDRVNPIVTYWLTPAGVRRTLTQGADADRANRAVYYLFRVDMTHGVITLDRLAERFPRAGDVLPMCVHPSDTPADTGRDPL